MKFVNAIHNGENLIGRLWLLVAGSLSLTVMFFFSTIYLVFRDPLIVERSCESKTVVSKSSAPTKLETESFIKEALAARFDTDRDKPSLMTVAQAETKDKELKELKSRNIAQVVFVDSLDLKSNGEFRAKLTRLLKVGAISTALGFSIDAKLYETRRTEDNPYGLILSEVKAVESEVKK